VPFVAPRAKEFGKKILGNVARTGMEMLGDVVSGKNVKQAANTNCSVQVVDCCTGSTPIGLL